MIKRLKSARARGVPLIAVLTADQPDCVRRIAANINGGSPVFTWDCVRGLRPVNDLARDTGFPEGDPIMFTDPVTFLEASMTAPQGAVIIALGGDRILSEPRPATAALLLRDPYSSTQRTLISLGSLFDFASELGSDVLMIEDPLPTEQERAKIAIDLSGSLQKELTEQEGAVCARFTRGLSWFSAQQTLALAMNREGIDFDVLSGVWREAVNATPGLRVLRDIPNEDAVAGLTGARDFMRALANGREPPEVLVLCDEVEKMLGGTTGDTSGTSQAIFGMMLTHLEDTKSDGKISAGSPGVGKTHLAKIAGGILRVPVVQFDWGAIKNSLVGESERNARRAFAALAGLGGRQFWIATTNNANAIPAELQRRFTSGIWMYDLPDRDERLGIWAVHLGQYEFIPKGSSLDVVASTIDGINDQGWTGADIRNVARLAWRTNRPLVTVAKSHVPSSRASATMIEQIRRAAAGTYFSASYPGPYRMPQSENEALVGRKLALEGVK